jgi:hypothetical protein
MGKLYRLDLPPGNGVLASLICMNRTIKAGRNGSCPAQDAVLTLKLDFKKRRTDPAGTGAIQRPPRQLLRGCPQSGAPAAKRHCTGWLEIAAVEIEGLQIFFDHALYHHCLIVFAKGCALAPMANFGLRNF